MKSSLHTANVILPATFDVKQGFNFPQIFGGNVCITDKKFPQITIEPRKVKVYFEALETQHGGIEIMQKAALHTADFHFPGLTGQQKLGLVIRALATILKQTGSKCVNEVIGKRIIVPVITQHQHGRPEVMVLDPVYKNDALWQLGLAFATEITGYNAVIPVLTN
jgi:hypothetical protein